MTEEDFVDHNDKTELEEYQEWVRECRWDSTKDMGLTWSAIAIGSEVGELQQIVEKIYRKSDGQITDEHIAALASELGDILWNVANICNDLDISMDTVLETNITKVNGRRYANETA